MPKVGTVRRSLYAVVAATALMLASTAISASAAPSDQHSFPSPPNVFVTSQSAQGFVGAPSIAQDPTDPAHLVIGYSLHNLPTPGVCYLASSYDYGHTWTSVAWVGVGARYPIPPPLTTCTGAGGGSGPAVAFGPDGTLYFAYIALKPTFGAFAESEFIMVSPDGGRTFSAPHLVDPNQNPATQLDDVPKIAVDQQTGTVYDTWTRYGAHFNPPELIVVAASTDHGATFSPPVVLNPGENPGGEQPHIAVGTDHAVSVDWVDDTASPPNTLGIAFAVSHDGGQTFSAARRLANVSTGCPNDDCDTYDDYSAVPTVAVAAGAVPGLVIVSFSGSTDPSVGAAADAPGPVRVYVMRSTDDGSSFSSPMAVGIPAGHEADRQMRPSMSISPHGRVDISYFDLTPDVSLEDTYLTSSADTGVAFGPAQRISTASSPTSAFFPGVGSVFAVGQGVVSAPGHALVTWYDSRRATAANNNKTDVVFADDPANRSAR